MLKHLDINKSPGPDGIHSRVLRETHAEIAHPLQIIFTKLMNEGKNPSIWKQAHSGTDLQKRQKRVTLPTTGL